MTSPHPIDLRHLQHGAIHQAFHYHDSGLNGDACFLPFYGQASRGGHVVAFLLPLPQDPKKPVVYHGNKYKEGTQWVIGFSGLPFTDQPAEYLVVVAECDDQIAQRLAVTVRLRVRTPPRPKKIKAAGGGPAGNGRGNQILVTAPTAGSILCSQQFNACGYYGNPLTISGTMSNTNRTVDAGHVIVPLDTAGQSTDLWILPFGPVADDTGYTLTVNSSDANVSSTTVGNLSTNANACSDPIGPPPPPPPPAAPSP